MMQIPVMFSFARSGGTLVNQLLGIHPDCLILSEVNPAASVVSLADQASDWMGLIGQSEIEQFEALSYGKQVAQLDELARSKNKVLIVRDWVTVNYLSGAGSVEVRPSGLLEQCIYLSHVGYSLRPLVITRKAATVYQSIRQNFFQFGSLSAEQFALSYLAYAHAVSDFPRVSLESLQNAPREALLRIMEALSLPTDHVDKQLADFANFQRCTGNNTLAKPSATAYLRNIVPVSRGSASSTDFAEIPAFAEADLLMGYEP